MTVVTIKWSFWQRILREEVIVLTAGEILWKSSWWEPVFPLQEKEDNFESVQLKSSRSQNIWRINAAFKGTNLISIFTGLYFKHILAHIIVVILVRNAWPFRRKEDRKQTRKLDCLTMWLSTLPKKRADSWIPYWEWNSTQEEIYILQITWIFCIHLGNTQACHMIYRYLSFPSHSCAYS